MSTVFYMRSAFRPFYLTLLFVVTASLAANALHAGIILVGTSTGVDTVANVNQLITTYNQDFNADLLTVNFQVNKLEQAQGSSNDIWTDGDWSADFDFFKVGTVNPVRALNVYGSSLEFTPIPSTSVIATDQKVLGFEHSGPQQFEYYVSKNATSFSLWAVSGSSPDGLHPIYTDRLGTHRGLISGSGTYDPRNNGVSHISFYSAVPEPNALVLVSFALISFSTLRRRKFLAKWHQ